MIIVRVARHLNSFHFGFYFPTCPCRGLSHYVCYCSDDLKANGDSYHLFIYFFNITGLLWVLTIKDSGVDDAGASAMHSSSVLGLYRFHIGGEHVTV